MRPVPRALIAFTAMAILAVAAAEEVDVPLGIGIWHLEGPLSAGLGMDDGGQSVLVLDACNRLTLSDLEVGVADDRLFVSVAATANSGSPLFNRCIGAVRWDGRLRVELGPTVAEDGLAIGLAPAALQLLRPDGSEGLLGRAVRPLAEALVLPRLGEVRLDLRESLAQIDDLLLELSGDADTGAPMLTERSRLTDVSVAAEDDALQATLRFDVEPPRSIAAPAPALDAAELIQWQRLEDELDGFLTTVILRLATQAQDRGLRLDLLAVLLDARTAIADALAEEQTPAATDPVRELFIRSWDQLRPHLAALERAPAAGEAAGLRLAGFVAGGDAIRALDTLGPEFGLEITRDGLRRLARMLLAEDAPASFTPLPLEMNPLLRELILGDDPNSVRLPRSDPAQPRQVHRPALERAPARVAADVRHFARWLGWLIPAARADETPASAAEYTASELVPRLADLDAYLDLISRLLEDETGARLQRDTRVREEYRALIPALIRATAWKESCWRQFSGTPDNPQVMTSSVGALGMMQIHARVWRGVYDLDRLADDVRYNIASGIEILEHYLVDYAIRRGEQDHPPGGAENLVRATYAAYNGGPSHLSRYRREDTAPRLRAIDREFWNHYQSIAEDGWPDVRSCYSVR